MPGSRGPPEPAVVSACETSDSGDFADARAHFIAGRYLDARETLMAGRGLSRPNDPRSAMLLVQCHANLGELTEALACCEHALASARTDVELHYLHANILQELERDEEALLALRNVLFLEPDHVLAQFTISHVHRRRNNMPAAAKHLANVRLLLSRRPDHEELPQSGGLTVGHMKAIVSATTQLEVRKKGRHHA